MSRTKLLILIAALLVSSGYRFRCYWLCTDQTSIQHDYIEERDRCREYAEAKVDMTMNNLKKNPNDEKARKGQLVSLFSECMANHGWTVPDGRDKNIAGATGGSSTGKDTTLSSAAAAATAQDAAAAGIITGEAARNSAAATDASTAVRGLSAGEAATAAGLEKAFLARKAECDFARHSANSSSIANARAQACDIECAQRVKNAPDAPRPAACPAEFNPSLSKGVERE